MALKRAFAELIASAQNRDLRTAKAAIPFKIFNALAQMDSEESEMVSEKLDRWETKRLISH